MPVRAGGDRPTFLLLHGIGLSHRSFTRAAKVLAGHGDIVAIDLPGFGGTPRPKHPLSVEDVARGVGDVLVRTRTGPVIAVGHSMGAQFALELALQRPELVTAVVMIGPVVDPLRRTLWQQAMALLRDTAFEPLRTSLMVQFDYLRCGPLWFLAETRAMLAYPTHERLRALTQPLLVLRGAHDPIADEAWVVRAAALAGSGGGPVSSGGGGPAISIPGFRHNVVHSGPAATAGHIARFAARLSASDVE
ncbi:hypothetical protein B7R25_15540 [Subtercola boreus]|uniref:AB hydrolase-1 domain-containing protein n=2 Tax=Subtercola boreus TaxID=120213 RepID=A0A3E0W8A7_9MICO|nr:hypothetical protein B7R25_15540 [Subtercola boreus]